MSMNDRRRLRPRGDLAGLARFTTALVALALLGAAAGGSGARAQERQILMLGSSSVHGAVGRTIAERLRERGLTLRRRARGSSGFARPDFYDWEAELPTYGPFEPYEAVLVYAGGNDVQALRLMPAERREGEERRQWIRWNEEARWRDLYAARVRSFVDALCTRGARRVVIILPANGGRAGWRNRIPRVRDAQARAAHGSRCGVTIDGGIEELDSVDGVHLSRRGARGLWDRIGDALLGALRS